MRGPSAGARSEAGAAGARSEAVRPDPASREEPVILYFAYGSNLSRAQMEARCPGARPVARAYIPDHRLGFAGRAPAWDGGGGATIVLAPGERCWGALYEVGPACLETLARHEGRDYTLSRTHVLREDGTRVHAYLFVRARGFDERAPSDRYVEVIRRGYREWGLDESALDRAVDSGRAAGVDSA
jgi:gamma-glutamylcyclotransferase